MGYWGRRIGETLAIGEPPRLIITFLLGLWLILVPAVPELAQFVALVYQPMQYSAGRKWEYSGFKRIMLAGYVSMSNVAGRLLASLVAPLVDNFKILHHVFIASLATGFVVFAVTALLTYSPSTMVSITADQQCMLYFILPVTMHFFHPFVVAFISMQFKDKIGAKTRTLFTIIYSAQYAFMGICTAVFFPVAPKYSQIVLNCILCFSIVSAVLCLCLLTILAIFVYKKKWLIKADYQRSETKTNLACLAKIMCYFKKRNRIERLLSLYSQKTVYDTKKVAKILLVLLAMSYQMSTMEFWQVAWVRQFTLSAAVSPFFSKVEFVTITNLLSAVLIPAIQYALVPQLRKFKFPLPVYSLMMCVGYICLCTGFIANIVIRSTVARVSPRYNPGLNEALYYVFNAMDTSTYVSAGGISRDVIPPGSIRRLKLKVGRTLRVMNFWYDVHYSYHIKTYQDDLIICTRQGVYQEYLGDFGWLDGYSASHLGAAKLTFLCQKDPSTGRLTDYCNEQTEFVVRKEGSVVTNIHMKNNSGPYNTTIELDPGHKYTIIAVFHGKPLNVETRGITFTPWQGVWYAFVVWSGDVHLKIKFKIATIKNKFKVSTLTALPQVVTSALGVSFLKVVISCMIHINTPESLRATTWAWYYLLERLVVPIFILLLIFGATALWLQLLVMVLALLFFILLLAALRVARYW